MIKFIRIDHRLLHGQVVFSWSKSLQINRILVVNDEAANDEFKKMSLELSKPQGIKLNIFTVENTLTKISKIEALSENIMMIFEIPRMFVSFAKVTQTLRKSITEAS